MGEGGSAKITGKRDYGLCHRSVRLWRAPVQMGDRYLKECLWLGDKFELN